MITTVATKRVWQPVLESIVNNHGTIVRGAQRKSWVTTSAGPVMLAETQQLLHEARRTTSDRVAYRLASNAVSDLRHVVATLRKPGARIEDASDALRNATNAIWHLTHGNDRSQRGQLAALHLIRAQGALPSTADRAGLQVVRREVDAAMRLVDDPRGALVLREELREALRSTHRQLHRGTDRAQLHDALSGAIVGVRSAAARAASNR